MGHSPTTGQEYGHLARAGHYHPPTHGLWGKHDHVRTVWEDQVTRFAVRSAIARLRERTSGRPLRVLDLGCGSGEGWDLLAGIRGERDRRLIPSEDIGLYLGVDISPDMISAGVDRLQDHAQAAFAVTDLNRPAAMLAAHHPFDLYYSCYGSLSHIDDQHLLDLVERIAAHQRGPALVVIDVHALYSPEWPVYWGPTPVPPEDAMRPYDMTWVYPPGERQAHRREFDDYRVRYWGGAELRKALTQVPALATRGHRISLVDRSVLVGRHMDTGNYHPGVPPLRSRVNSLFAFNQHTAMDGLLAPTLPPTPDADAAADHAAILDTWNAAVRWFGLLSQGRPAELEADHLAERIARIEPLRTGMLSLVAGLDAVEWLDPGDPWSNLLQPQFGLFLRQIEWHMQHGSGCGHGLLAVVELEPA
jgi:SAM-dependent methyltransferase